MGIMGRVLCVTCLGKGSSLSDKLGPIIPSEGLENDKLSERQERGHHPACVACVGLGTT